MSYVQQAIILLFLLLFLQAAKCSESKLKKAPLSIAPSPSVFDHDKKLPLGSQDDDDDDDTDAGYGSGTDAGYDSDADFAFDPYAKPDADALSKPDADALSIAKPVDTQQPLPPSDGEKNNVIFNFEEQILSLRKVADLKKGIIWNLSGDRLERVVDDSSSRLYAGEDYMVQVLNIYRAAKKICSLYGQDDSFFASKANEFCLSLASLPDKLETFWIQQVKKINKAVVSQLQGMVFQNENSDSINKNLRLAENYVGLDDTHYNVTTTFEVAGKIFKLEDTKWLKLTEKQKLAFTSRKSENWYKRLEPFEQKFIDAYVDKFLDGKHYIPTQLRSIPGCRNAYQKRILDGNNQTVLASYYHSASLVSPIEWADKATDLEITKDNWEQVTSQDQNVEVLSLNYNMDLPVFKQIREKKIVEDTKKVVGADRFMNVSINGIGTSFNFNNQYNKLVEDSVTLYKKEYPRLCKSFTEVEKDKNFAKKLCNVFKEHPAAYRHKKIEKINDPKDKNFFKRLATLAEAANSSQTWNNLKQFTYLGNNPNATACANYIACKASLKKATSTSSVLFSCKSGKDRTGLMSYLVDGNIIQMHHPLLAPDKSKEVYQALANTGHYQLLASLNGGMPGRFGMKHVRTNEVSSDFVEQLFPKAAHSTVIGLH